MGELATLMLAVALSAEGFQVVTAPGDVQTRALGTAAVALIALVIGLRVGRRMYQRERIRAIGWLPDTVTWHRDADGGRHAIVKQNSGTVVSIPIPPGIAGEDELTYVLVSLNEARRRIRRRWAY